MKILTDNSLTVLWNRLKKGVLNNRNYEPTEFSGKGYKVLEKNIQTINGVKKNILTSAMINQPNTIYEIRYDFNLEEDITIPSGCILKFNGGSVTNNNFRIIGNETQIIPCCVKPLFNLTNICISGSWNVPTIHSWFFKDLSYDNALKNVFALTNGNIHNKVILYKEKYDYVFSFSRAHQAGITVESNTEIIINGTIRVRGNGLQGYRLFFGEQKDHILFSGDGELIGDFYDNNEDVPQTGKHDFSEKGDHSYCHGIVFYDSKNITISGLKIGRFPGDAIGVANTSIDKINYHVVEGCELYKCRRQGVTVIGREIIVQNNYFHNIIGTDPQSAIDVEPNNNNYPCSNIQINNNIIKNCYRGILLVSDNGQVENVSISNNKVNVMNIFSYSSGDKIRNVKITNNNVYSENNGLTYPYIKQCLIKNNTLECKGFGIYNNPKCYGLIIENNYIKSATSNTIVADNAVLTNNEFVIDNEKQSIMCIYLSGTICFVENNTIRNGWIKVSGGNNISIKNNCLTYKAVQDEDCIIDIVKNLIFKNNTIKITENGNNVLKSALRLNVCIVGEVKNNNFIIPDDKVSNCIWITGASNKIEIKNTFHSGLPLSDVISNNSNGEIFIEGLYSNFRKNSTIPEWDGQRDMQVKRVTYIDESSKKFIISDGVNQYNSLGHEINTIYKTNRIGLFRDVPTTGLYVGFEYFATDKGVAGVGSIIYYTGNTETPWVYADGTAVL